MIDLPKQYLEEALSCLKFYQQEDIKSLLLSNENDIEKVARIYLYAQGASNTVKFGGGSSTDNLFFDILKLEVKKFVCGDSKYDSERKKLKETSEVCLSKRYLTICSAAIATNYGLIATALYVVVSLILVPIISIGVTAYCSLDTAT